MDITEAVVAIFSVSIVIGLPMAALCVRFALKPTIEAWLKIRESVPKTRPSQLTEVGGLRLRVAALEAIWENRLGAGTLTPTRAARLTD